MHSLIKCFHELTVSNTLHPGDIVPLPEVALAPPGSSGSPGVQAEGVGPGLRGIIRFLTYRYPIGSVTPLRDLASLLALKFLHFPLLHLPTPVRSAPLWVGRAGPESGSGSPASLRPSCGFCGQVGPL